MATALRPLSRISRGWRPRLLEHLATLLLWVVFAAPVAIGVLGTVLPAFGILPELGGSSLSLQPWRQLFNVPGLPEAVLLSLTTGLGTTAISFLIFIAFSAHWHGTRWFGRLRRLLSPLLSVPHVAIAIGFAFLIAPSGWIYRVLAALGLAAGLPPDLSTVQDRHGLALILGLILKEVPFLLLMMLVALGQVRVGESLTIARALGHSRSAAWQAIVLPQLYPQLRLPIYAVLAYSASVVDVALILGPTTPPSLAVLVWRGFHDPDLNQIFWASAGACLQLLIALFAILLWRLGELVASASGRRRIVAGWPGRPSRIAASAAFAGAALVVAAAIAGLAATLLWSFTKSWTIGSAMPEALTLATWMQQLPVALKALTATAVIGISSAMAALLLSIALLEEERRESLKARQRHYWLLYAPLLLPQIGFLFGIETLLVRSDLDGTWSGLVWTHFLFVLPYVYLSLSEPWRALDPRYERTARCLGRGPLAVLVTLKLPLLVRPILVALALCFAVSVGQYLPTLFAGAGRFQTLTTEAVALAAGGDRRVVGVYTALQMFLPALGFALALGLTRRRFQRSEAGV